MIKFCALSSGSKGNSIYIESDHTRVLVDIGLSALQIRKRLESIGVNPADLDAIVLTHAHRDHVQGAGVFSRQFNTPIYGHPETLQSIAHYFKKKEPRIPWNGPFEIGDLHFSPFRVSHDAFPTVGYRIEQGTTSLAICTDLGHVTREVTENLVNVQALVIESNHDPNMLMNGPYPWDLKERIASRVGHLSNHDTGLLLKNILGLRLKKICLAHLSDENNTPQTALETVLEYIGESQREMVSVLEQRTISPVHII